MSSLGATFHPVFRRAVEDGPGSISYELPSWSIWVVLADLIVFIPLLFFVGVPWAFLLDDYCGRQI